MAVLSFTIPNEYIDEVVEAFAVKHRYPAMVPDTNTSGKLVPDEIPNPQSKAQFAKQIIRDFIRNTYVAHKAEKEAELAKITARSTAVTIADEFR